jgi:heme/copper-type cytochrome/quinol oxidase subunit 3
MFRMAFAALVMTASLAAVFSRADAQQRQIQVGQLTCSVSAGVGLVVGSQKNVNCVFRGQPGEPEEGYTGTMTTVGLDIGFTTGGVIEWTVFADTNRRAGMLAGTYGGATAEASVAVGLGANVLVGGSQRSVALQPLSVQGQKGINVAAGIGQLELYPLQ